MHMIRRGQAVGFNLDEMKKLIELKAKTGQLSLDIANELIFKKRGELKNDIDKIMSLDQQLMDLHEEINRTFG